MSPGPWLCRGFFPLKQWSLSFNKISWIPAQRRAGEDCCRVRSKGRGVWPWPLPLLCTPGSFPRTLSSARSESCLCTLVMWRGKEAREGLSSQGRAGMGGCVGGAGLTCVTHWARGIKLRLGLSADNARAVGTWVFCTHSLSVMRAQALAGSSVP